MAQRVYCIATMDTKGSEIQFVARCLRSAGSPVATVDVGTLDPPVVSPDITRGEISACHPRGVRPTELRDRGEAVTAMGESLREFLLQEHSRGGVSGVLGVGGSGGTALITAAMRGLPIGVPKLMVSTVASGNVAQYIDCTDITLMYSVVDIAGLNAVSKRVLSNAAHAMAGMAASTIEPIGESRRGVGMTMFGVTTPCVTAVRTALEQDGFECYVFHATGSGGRAMEKLVESDFIQSVLDITTTEVADEVVGGIFPAGPNRFDAMVRQGIPYIVSLGALDMVNFGPQATVPERFRDRRLHVHNAQVTLMRTSVEENRLCARWIASKLNRSRAPLAIVIPERGLSMLDRPGEPFHDPAANEALFEELTRCLEPRDGLRIVRAPYHVNDAEFSRILIDLHREMVPAEK